MLKKCPKCGGTNFVNAGLQSKSKRQMYKCQGCGYRSTFTNDVGGRPPTALFCIECGAKKIYAKKRCSSCYRKMNRRKKQT